MSGRVGTGNIAGVATAIAAGGPGAVYWMCMVAFLRATTAYIEGHQDGQEAGRQEAADHIAAVASGMLGGMENRVQSHHAGCWRTHPACALSAVLRAAQVARR